MDPVAFAVTIAAPFLKKLVDKAADGAATKFGEDVWAQAKTLWDKFLHKIKDDPIANTAAESIKADLSDKAAQATFVKQIKKLLAEDPEFARDVQNFMASPLAPPVLDRSDLTQSHNGGVHIKQVLEGYSWNHEQRIFDITVGNKSHKQILLTAFEFEWRYHKGYLASIAQGIPLIPNSRYSIQFQIDVLDDSIKSLTETLYPSILMPPSNQDGPSIFTFRLDILYSFIGRLDYHPCSDWNIEFSVAMLADDGNRCSILAKQYWRVKQYEEKRKIQELSHESRFW
jgi:hypothetical protein